jgi:RimJ/RimL family protein N-acetyltransferase
MRLLTSFCATPSLPSPDGQVLLRPFLPSDADFLLASFQDLEARENTPLVDPVSFDLARRWIRSRSSRGRHPLSPAWLITDGSGVRCGAIGATSIDWEHHRVEFYYWVLAPFRRHGLASRALETISLWALNRGLTHLELMIDTANVVSVKVALKAGYQFERLHPNYRFLTGKLVDAAAYVRRS